jgi:thiol-disulfide isomerase/thioredoxin
MEGCALKNVKLETFSIQYSSLNEITKNKPFVIVLLTPDCPIAQKYTSVLRGLIAQYAQIEFLLVFTKWDDWQVIETFQKDYLLSISVYRDINDKLVKKINATVTPEVFFFDKNAVLLYQGAIDNWFFSLGKHRQMATECYLEEALNAHINGISIKIKKTNAVGCIIEK